MQQGHTPSATRSVRIPFGPLRRRVFHVVEAVIEYRMTSGIIWTGFPVKLGMTNLRCVFGMSAAVTPDQARAGFSHGWKITRAQGWRTATGVAATKSTRDATPIVRTAGGRACTAHGQDASNDDRPNRRGRSSYFCTLAQLSRRVTVRLKTSRPGRESAVSTQK